MSGPDEEVLTPTAGLPRRAEHAAPQVRTVAPRILLALADNLAATAARALAADQASERAGQARLWHGSVGGVPVTLCAPGVGAPAAALATEKLIAAGARVLVSLGYAGGLGPHGRGAVLGVDGTLRGEEGLSGHYGFSGRVVPADGSLSVALRRGADAAGLAVTTDALYRETPSKVAAWRAAGALAVDMETAGVLAPAAFRGARAAGVLVVTDTLTERWTPAAPGSVDAAVGRGLALALETLVAEPLGAPTG